MIWIYIIGIGTGAALYWLVEDIYKSKKKRKYYEEDTTVKWPDDRGDAI